MTRQQSKSDVPRTWALMALMLFASLPWLGGCSGNPAGEIPKPGPIERAWLPHTADGHASNLLLITLDTTRQDRLGCYGAHPTPTPALDALAERGILFEHAITPIPVTLPAHATILTGLNPPEHGVRHNGSYSLDAKHVTLAEVLSAAGFATGATLGAFPVAAQFGLDQGFSTYDDDFPLESRRAEWQTVERRADQVTDLALTWLAEHGHEPFFHWIHYFDPHAPYDPPATYLRRFPDPYTAEIAFMDAEIERLLEGLGRLGHARNTWILCVADHGEALGEHGEATHSLLLYRATQEVPCILVPPVAARALSGLKIPGQRISAPIALRDLAPTLLNALGLASDALPATGMSLLPLIAQDGPAPPVLYMETLVPFLEFGWSELRAVRTSRWSYCEAPAPELYDLTHDPAEEQNVITRWPEVAARLSAWVKHMGADSSATSAPRPLDRTTIEKLRSLGYLAGSPPQGSARNAKDPKALIHLAQMINRARSRMAERPDSVRRLLEAVLHEDPANPTAARLLAKACLRLGDWPAALSAYDTVIQQIPADADAQLGRAWASMMTGDTRSAEETLERILAKDPFDVRARALYAGLLAQAGRYDEARMLLNEGVRISPDEAEPFGRLALFEWERGQLDRARHLAKDALTRDPDHAAALAILGEAVWLDAREAARMGHASEANHLLTEAQETLERALAVHLFEPMAAFRLAFLAHEAGDTLRACELYGRVISTRPDMVLAHVNLAHLLRRRGDAVQAVRHYEIADQLGFREVSFFYNYGAALVLAGRSDDARVMWQRALGAGPSPRSATRIRQEIETLGSR